MKQRIVIVERRTDAAEALWEDALSHGFTPDVVFDFDMATRKMMEARLPDAILLSSTKDERINRSFLKTLRSAARTRNLPVFVIVSGGESARAAAMKAGATHCMEAPFQSAELFSCIKAVVRRSTLR
jgi:DNA-binding response OmpR family regulator